MVAYPIASSLRRLRHRLSEPIDGASLAVFRVLFGVIVVVEVYRFFSNGWINEYWAGRDFLFKYYGFGWVHPWPDPGMQIHFAVIAAAASCVALGLWYRPAAIILSIAFTYQFLLDQTRYLNHFYAIALFCFLLTIIPADRSWSVATLLGRQRGEDQRVPVWALWLLRFQVSVIYFYAGIAKLNAEWLAGGPARQFISHKRDIPFIRMLDALDLAIPFFTYGGLLLDLLVVPALLWKITRPLAFLAALAFHFLNGQLFSIGIFPWLMVAATTLFFDADWPRRALGMVAPQALPDARSSTPFRPLSRAALAAIGAYVAVQCLVPLRHLLYPGDVNWNQQGHRFSWRMMLNSRQGYISYRVASPRDTIIVDPTAYLTPLQAYVAAVQPDMILQFAHFLATKSREAGDTGVTVYAVGKASLNGALPAPLVDPHVDLARQRRSLGHASWILRPASQREGQN